MRFKSSLWILVIIGLISCKQKSTEKETDSIKEPKVVSAHNKIALKEIRELYLDSTYTNLLDPRNVTESEYKDVTKSWTEFHKKVLKFIEEEDFKWDVPDSMITIANRIYFDKNGTIDYYTFKIRNPSISAEKSAEYEKVLQKFCKEITLDLKRNENFAQCGNIKYVNY